MNSLNHSTSVEIDKDHYTKTGGSWRDQVLPTATNDDGIRRSRRRFERQQFVEPSSDNIYAPTSSVSSLITMDPGYSQPYMTDHE